MFPPGVWIRHSREGDITQKPRPKQNHQLQLGQAVIPVTFDVPSHRCRPLAGVLSVRIGHGRPGYCQQRPNNISGGRCLDTLAQDELAMVGRGPQSGLLHERGRVGRMAARRRRITYWNNRRRSGRLGG